MLPDCCSRRSAASCPVRPLRGVQAVSTKADETAAAISVDELHALAPSDFFERLYAHRYGEVPPTELMSAFNELTQAAVATEELP